MQPRLELAQQARPEIVVYETEMDRHWHAHFRHYGSGHASSSPAMHSQMTPRSAGNDRARKHITADFDLPICPSDTPRMCACSETLKGIICVC